MNLSFIHNDVSINLNNWVESSCDEIRGVNYNYVHDFIYSFINDEFKNQLFSNETIFFVSEIQQNHPIVLTLNMQVEEDYLDMVRNESIQKWYNLNIKRREN